MSWLPAFDPRNFINNVLHLKAAKEADISKTQTRVNLIRARFLDADLDALLQKPDQLNAVISHLEQTGDHPQLLKNLRELRDILSAETTKINPVSRAGSTDSLGDEPSEQAPASKVELSQRRDFGLSRLTLRSNEKGLGGKKTFGTMRAHFVLRDALLNLGDGSVPGVADNSLDIEDTDAIVVAVFTDLDSEPAVDALSLFESRQETPSVTEFSAERPYILWEQENGQAHLSFLTDLGDVVRFEIIEKTDTTIVFKDPFSQQGTVSLSLPTLGSKDEIKAFQEGVLSKLTTPPPAPDFVTFWSDANGDYARVQVNGPGVVDHTGRFKEEAPFFMDFEKGKNEYSEDIWVYDDTTSDGSLVTYLAVLNQDRGYLSSAPVTIIENREEHVRFVEFQPAPPSSLHPVKQTEPAYGAQYSLLTTILGENSQFSLHTISHYAADTHKPECLYLQGFMDVEGKSTQVNLVVYLSKESKPVVVMVPRDWPMRTDTISFSEVQQCARALLTESFAKVLQDKISSLYEGQPKKEAEFLKMIGVKTSSSDAIAADALDLDSLKVESFSWNGTLGGDGTRDLKINGSYKGFAVVFKLNIDNPKAPFEIEQYDSAGKYITTISVEGDLREVFLKALLNKQVQGEEEKVVQMDASTASLRTGVPRSTSIVTTVTKSLREWLDVDASIKSTSSEPNFDEEIAAFVKGILGTTPAIARDSNGALESITLSFPKPFFGEQRDDLVIKGSSSPNPRSIDTTVIKFLTQILDAPGKKVSPIRLKPQEWAGRLDAHVKSGTFESAISSKVVSTSSAHGEFPEVHHFSPGYNDPREVLQGKVSPELQGKVSPEDVKGLESLRSRLSLPYITIKSDATFADETRIYFTEDTACLVSMNKGQTPRIEYFVHSPQLCAQLHLCHPSFFPWI